MTVIVLLLFDILQHSLLHLALFHTRVNSFNPHLVQLNEVSRTIYYPHFTDEETKE